MTGWRRILKAGVIELAHEALSKEKFVGVGRLPTPSDFSARRGTKVDHLTDRPQAHPAPHQLFPTRRPARLNFRQTPTEND